MRVSEALGQVAGSLLAPWVAAAGRILRERLGRPEVLVFRARVTPLVIVGPLARFSRRVSGEALVRCSSVLWRGSEWSDLLGCAVRMCRSASDPRPSPDDQDLLFATARSPWTVSLAPLTTRQHDFLANDYFGVFPFELPGLGLARLRLAGSDPGVEGPTRAERLRRAAALGQARFRLDARKVGDPSGRWHPVATVRLVAPARLDEGTCRFDPFNTGRGIEPRGFVPAFGRRAFSAGPPSRPP